MHTYCLYKMYGRRGGKKQNNHQTKNQPDNAYGMCMEFKFLKSEVEKSFPLTYLTVHLITAFMIN